MELNYERLLKGFTKIIDERNLESMNKQLYTFFTLYCDFIAHYNIHGFKHEYEGRRFVLFLKQFTNPPFYLGINLDDEKKRCINSMIAYAKKYEADILFEMKNRLENEKIQRLRTLANELGYDIVTKGSIEVEEPLSISSDGQFTLF